MRLCALSLSLFLVVPAVAAKPEKADKQKKTDKKVEKVEVVSEKPAKADTASAERDELKVSGVLEAGFDINNKVNRKETDYNRIGYGKIEISARPVKKVRAEFGFEYKDRDSMMVIDKLYAQYNFADFGGVRIGYMKKSFGLEERAGVEERYFHKRSIVNDGLEDVATNLLKHDLTFQYRHKIGEKWRLVGGFSWAADSVYGVVSWDPTRFHQNYYQNYSVEYEDSTKSLILAGIIGHYTHPAYDLTAWATSLSFKYLARLFVSETELTFGNKPLEYLDDESAFFWGARLQEHFPLGTGLKTLRQVIPVAEAALYSKDMESKDFDAQLRAGVTLGFAKNSAFQWRNTYGTVLRIRDGERELRRRRYDSEVVVVF
ncbi:MAG: hypothetical protein LBQ76_06350 [Candidatus Fibromonas sp.]|jgi:hypothetical protein|nr:hypothetical protein [Candidatus Fibromonas sp.]